MQQRKTSSSHIVNTDCIFNMETSFALTALCVCSLLACSASQRVLSNLTVSPSPDQALGSTLRTSITLENSNFNIGWWFGSIRIYRCIFLPPGSINCAVGATVTSRVNASRQIASTGVTIDVNIFNLVPTDNGLRIQVLDSLNVTLDAGKILNVKECTNLPSPVISNITTSPCGFGCKGTFSCESGYSGNGTGTCQNNAMWDIGTSICNKICNNTNIPTNSTFQAPTSGTTVSPNTQTLNCIGNYAGTVTAQCLADGNWNIISYDCNGTCDQRMIPSDISLNNSLMAVSQVGESVIVPCNAGNVTYIGIAYANCTGPGQWESSNCSGELFYTAL
uniref:E-selectin-like n=1 Tax=Phallusia mammillata TaxID=59560 RepID=A0A6F9DR86_9ASCI|nr:E-selectin-like [Phallusia mammillata]